MKMHYMLDLETLDTTPTAVVTTVGIVPFDPESDWIGKPMHFVISDWLDQQKHGRTISGKTVQWWLQQEPAAIKALLSEDAAPTESVLKAIIDMFDPYDDVYVWGNGADFDNIILGSLFEAYGLNKPWSYGRNRCYRTMKNLGYENKVPQSPFEGTKHNAADDAWNQAHYLQQVYAWIKKNSV